MGRVVLAAGVLKRIRFKPNALVIDATGVLQTPQPGGRCCSVNCLAALQAFATGPCWSSELPTPLRVCRTCTSVRRERKWHGAKPAKAKRRDSAALAERK